MKFALLTKIKRCIVKFVHLSVRLSENEVGFAYKDQEVYCEVCPFVRPSV